MIKIRPKVIVDILFVIVAFLVTRQAPLSFLSPVMNFAVLAIIIISLSINRLNVKNTCLVAGLLIFPLLVSLFYSVLFTDNSLINAFKFFIVLICLGLAYFVFVSEKALKWFIWINVLQAIIIVIIFVIISIYFTNHPRAYLPIRFYFQELGWGDIYTYNGYFFRVQIKGSALLLIAIILNNETDLIKRKSILQVILIIGLILAGNFAFLIAGFIYLLYYILRLQGKTSLKKYIAILSLSFAILILLMPSIINYVTNTIEGKKKDSLGARDDQATHLMDSVFENPFTTLVGQGLGNTLNIKSVFRDYTGQTYYELQTLYVFNQLGFVFFLIFLLYNIIIIIRYWGVGNFKILAVYLVYICYAVTNPYIFDTNHFIVIIILGSWIQYDKRNKLRDDNSNNCAIPS